ncbi:glycosyltransferase family 4 protein [Bhargavaea ginsengi]|uniref:glycosyltransferase family 4 protein n=1 Tax=Bhargavaea ginsengi TaxID=426757 RepID=UPI003C717C9B
MKRNKKILQLCAVDFSAKTLLIPLIKRTIDEGHEVHLACGDTGSFNELASKGIVMREVNIDRKISPISNIRSIMQLYKLFKTEQYDVVHVHTPVASLLGRIAAKMAGVPNIIYTAHGFYFHDEMVPSKYKTFYYIEKFAGRFFTDYLLVQSKEDYDTAVKGIFLKNTGQIIHLSNGVNIWDKFYPKLIDEDDITETRKQIGLDNDAFVFLFIGRLVREKGILELIKAFNELQKHKSNAVLLLVGDVNPSERDQELIEKLPTLLSSSNVFHLGFRTDIPKLLSIANVFVLPSHREGLPRSIIEAMAMEKAIIASNIRGCREEVFPNQNGILFEKENTQELRNAMEELIENPLKTKQFGLKSREIAEKRFDEKKVLDKQINLFNKL